MKKKIPTIKPGEFGDGECGRKFRIKNYKSFKNEIEFYLPKFTLLIGPNNSGKSTLNSWFKLLKTDWKNLDPIELENRTFEEVLNRYSQENTIEFTYFLQLNIKKEIEVKLFYKNDNTKTSLGGEELNTGLLDKAIIYFDSKPLFEINSYEYFDPKDGKIKINIKNLIRLLSYKKISILNDNMLLLDKYDFKELFFNLDEELKKLKKFPDEIEIILFSGFFRTYNKDKYALFDLNEIGNILNIEINAHFQFQIFKLIRGILNGASLNFEKFTSIIKNEDYVTKVNHNEFTGNDIHQDFEIIKELTGINLRLLTIKDDSGKFYGHRVQINEDNEWVYLDSLGQGYRSFVNLLLNYLLSSNTEASSIKFYFMEEPENTLHPDLIVKLLNLLIEFTKTDLHSRNFIIETHSLIILKYFQLAVAKGILKPEDINIYEFSKGDDLSTDVSRKTIDKHGFLSSDFSNGFTNHVLDMELELWRIQQSLINKN